MNYQTESERIEKFIKEYVQNSDTTGVVLGMSGGIDSAVVAVIAKNALGIDNVELVYLPEIMDFHITDINEKHIQNFCKTFDMRCTTYSIGEPYDVFTLIEFGKKLTLANIKARIRMVYLYAVANSKNKLVIGTTNKSESLVGYFTKHGDGGADIEPIQHLYKTEIFDLARHLDIPSEIINKPPSAGLWEGQTDESELGITYEQLDKCLKYYDAISNSPRALTELFYNTEDGKKLKNMKPEKMDYVTELIKKSEHKRKLPPSLKRE